MTSQASASTETPPRHERAEKALRLETPPAFGAFAEARRPFRGRPGQMCFERALPDPKDVMPFAPDYLPHELPAMAGTADDLLDRHPVLCKRHDRGVCLLAAEIPFILDALGRAEQVRIDSRRPNGAADLAHRLANRIEECPMRTKTAPGHPD